MRLNKFTRYFNADGTPTDEGMRAFFLKEQTASVGAVAWGDVTGKPSTFPPSSHTQAISTITGLQTALDGKAATTHTHTLSQLTQSGATTGQVPQWSGSAWVPATVAGGATDLSYTASTRLLASSSGADVTLPLVGSDAGLMSAADKSKLDGIASGATANASNADLRDRATHTGTQAASTITGLATVATTGAYSDLTGIPSTFAPSAHTHAASDINSGTLATAQLGSGTANSSTFLRGDQTWATPTASATATDFFSQSFTSQGPGFATDTYLTGSSILIPSAGVKVGTRYILRFRASKTAAGTATPIINIRFGTNQTTADTARLTFTLRAQTAAADEGIFDVEAIFTADGATATLGGIAFARHRQTTTGFQNAVTGEQVATGSAFDSTVANSYIGASVNGGTSAAWTVTFKSAMLLGTN